MLRERWRHCCFERMADDGSSSKRLKTSEDDGVVIAELRRRNAELESENEQLRRRGRQEELESENEKLKADVVHLRTENAQLRGRLSRGGSHEVLPILVITTVNLSRIDPCLVTQITSFLGTSRELLNLALTCKSFGASPARASLNWSTVEEVARQAVRSRATDDEMSSLPRFVSGRTTWLSILHRFEHLLLFDVLLGGGLEHRDGDKSRVYGTTDDHCTALSSSYVMSSGSHYAEFQFTALNYYAPFFGVARTMPKRILGSEDFCFFRSVHFDTFLAARTDEWGDGNVHACQYFSLNGHTIWTDFEGEGTGGYHWADWEGMERCRTGDTIGMLLNLDAGTLSVYKNNRHLGIMTDGLSGPYCWYVRVRTGQSVAIKRGELP